MRFVDRTSVDAPESLIEPIQAVADERKAALEYYVPDGLAPGVPIPRISPAYDFKQYKRHDVGVALYKLFEGKCAYCESEVGAPNDEEIEHYRPKGGITGEDDHNGYWWLASAWPNLLLSCTGCNQSRRQHLVTPGMSEKDYLDLIAAPPATSVGKLNQFPIAGTRAVMPWDDIALEEPHLIDPTARDPTPSLRWLTASEFSVVVPPASDLGEDPYGAATIAICALNRSKLVKARTGLLRQLRLFREKIFEQLERDSSDVGAAQATVLVNLLRSFTEPGKPYSAMATAYVEELTEELRAWMHSRQAEAAKTAIEGAVTAARAPGPRHGLKPAPAAGRPERPSGA